MKFRKEYCGFISLKYFDSDSFAGMGVTLALRGVEILLEGFSLCKFDSVLESGIMKAFWHELYRNGKSIGPALTLTCDKLIKWFGSTYEHVL